MENYGHTAVKVLGMCHAFLRWKDKVYKQLFYITDYDRSPNLLSRDACYKTCQTCTKEVPIHLQDAFHEEIRNLEALGILEETKDVTEWVNSFVIMEKIPIDSNNSHSPGQETKDLLGS